MKHTPAQRREILNRARERMLATFIADALGVHGMTDRRRALSAARTSIATAVRVAIERAHRERGAR